MFFPVIIEEKTFSKITIANVAKDTTDKLLLEDLFLRNKENGIYMLTMESC